MKAVKTDLFERTPIRQAVLSQIIPAIASQMIALVYSLADTYFVGLLNDPAETAAVTVVYPAFVMLTALSNLFGVGGASTMARALGSKEPHTAKEISALSFWGGLIISVLFSGVFLAFASPVIQLCGGRADTMAAAMRYARWVVVIGGPFAVLNTLLANLVRSEGGAAQASIGVSVGGIVNIVLDPFFVLPRFLGFGAAGAGMATAISNAIATAYFLFYLRSHRNESVISLNLRLLQKAKKHIGRVLSIGLPSALQHALTVVAVAAQARFVADHQITEAVAALGIVKKLDQLPLYFAIGAANGLLPLLAFNYASGNHERRRKCFLLGTGISFGFALLCLIVYEVFAPQLVSLFIANAETVAYGAKFLRIMVTAMPLMAICYPMIIQFQAMGKVKASLVCSVLRKGVIDIPLLFLMDALFPLIGIMWVQSIVDSISLVVALVLYRRVSRAEEIYVNHM